MSNKYEENHTPTAQSSLAGGKICQEEKLLCGKRTELQRKYKLISIILVGIIIMATVVLILSYDKCKVKGHVWSSATCTDPQRCTVCDVTEGSPLGHDWLDATCTEPQTCQTCGKTEGSATDHTWKDATCTEPKTCQICGKAEGSATDHTWKDATCTEPKTCKVCGRSEGEALGHDWQDATYQRARTCAQCKNTDGRSLAYPLTLCAVTEDSNEQNSQSDVQKGDFYDVHTIYYRDSLKFWVSESSGWVDTEYIVYDLYSFFELLEFTISAEANNHSDGTVKILIYADNVLVYESEWVGNRTYPVHGSLEVSGIQTLKIVCTTDSPVFCYGIFDADLYMQG